MSNLDELIARFVTSPHRSEQELANLRAVIEFYDLSMTQDRAEEAAEKFLHPDYIQHDPNVDDGAGAYIWHAKEMRRRSPNFTSHYKHVLVDGDYVICHGLWDGLTNESFTAREEGVSAVAAIDIFRFRNGRIAEHWDVIQPMPAHWANPHGMF